VSKPRYDWWTYAKGMIKRYPQLCEQHSEIHSMAITPSLTGMPHGSEAQRTTELIAIRELPSTTQREYEAVRRALQIIERYGRGKDRLELIKLVFWDQSHTIAGAAMRISEHSKECTEDIAKKWHGAIIKLVAQQYGLIDK